MYARFVFTLLRVVPIALICAIGLTEVQPAHAQINPYAPVLSATAASPHEVELTWSWIQRPGYPFQGIEVRRSNTEAGIFDNYVVVADLVPSARSYSDTDVVDERTYWYRLAPWGLTILGRDYRDFSNVTDVTTPPVELIDNGDGTITDTATNLMWLKNANLVGHAMTWMEAVQWASDLEYADHDDWRLPSGTNPDGTVCNSRPSGYNCTQTEFASLYFGHIITILSPGPFENLGYGSYWTATPWPDNPSHAMAQDFLDGGQNDFPKDSYFGAWAVRGESVTGVVDEVPGLETTRLLENVPNPFNPSTTINFILASSGPVEVRVYDVAGRLVQILANSFMRGGRQQVNWTGKDRKGVPVASGVYVVELRAGGMEDTQKVTLVR
jgi:hypothetical protein